MASDELWRLVEARHDDGTPAMFRIRDLTPRSDQPRIFVVELPYPTTELSRLPDAAAYRRLGQFEEQWVRPAAAALDLSFVAVKTDDGSFFLYLYGAGEPRDLIARLSPFDGALGFFDEHDPTWDEYAALRELLAQATDLEPEAEAQPPADAAIDEAPVAVENTRAATHAATPAAARRPAVPTKPAPTKRPATKRPATKTAAKKPAAKKPAAKKPAAKEPTAKRSAAKKPAATRSAAKKPAAKKSAAKKAARKKR